MTAATDALKDALEDARSNHAEVEAATRGAISEGKRAQQELEASARAVRELEEALSDLERAELARQKPAAE